MKKCNLELEKKLAKLGDDTVVRCSKCGRTQYLRFENGLKNGWSKCCDGLTMPIIYISKMPETMDNAVKKILSEVKIEVGKCE